MLFFYNVYAADCGLLRVRYEALKEEAIYEDLMKEADSLIRKACDGGNQKAARAADKVLRALEEIKYPEEFSGGKFIANRRLRKATLLINETKKYSSNNPQLYAYQILFHHVAKENYRVKDYNYSLKYSIASYMLGMAILELR